MGIGIDAPRMARPVPRVNYWNGKDWVTKTAGVKGYGRHCEVVIKALKIANPQWTPILDDAPPWMRLGFDLFQTAGHLADVYEVFPSASYALLRDVDRPRVSLSFAQFTGGPKDMLDACVSAYTVYQYINGNGSEVGGGDGFGTIILPTPLAVSPNHGVLTWPAKN